MAITDTISHMGKKIVMTLLPMSMAISSLAQSVPTANDSLNTDTQTTRFNVAARNRVQFPEYNRATYKGTRFADHLAPTAITADEQNVAIFYIDGPSVSGPATPTEAKSQAQQDVDNELAQFGINPKRTKPASITDELQAAYPHAFVADVSGNSPEAIANNLEAGLEKAARKNNGRTPSVMVISRLPVDPRDNTRFMYTHGKSAPDTQIFAAISDGLNASGQNPDINIAMTSGAGSIPMALSAMPQAKIAYLPADANKPLVSLPSNIKNVTSSNDVFNSLIISSGNDHVAHPEIHFRDKDQNIVSVTMEQAIDQLAQNPQALGNSFTAFSQEMQGSMSPREMVGAAQAIENLVNKQKTMTPDQARMESLYVGGQNRGAALLWGAQMLRNNTAGPQQEFKNNGNDIYKIESLQTAPQKYNYNTKSSPQFGQ